MMPRMVKTRAPKPAPVKSSRKPPRAKVTSKSTKSTTINSNDPSPVQVQNQTTYNKLIKKGMSPKQAAAFAHHAGGGVGGKSKGGKSSKPTTRKLTRSKKK